MEKIKYDELVGLLKNASSTLWVKIAGNKGICYTPCDKGYFMHQFLHIGDPRIENPHKLINIKFKNSADVPQAPVIWVDSVDH